MHVLNNSINQMDLLSSSSVSKIQGAFLQIYYLGTSESSDIIYYNIENSSFIECQQNSQVGMLFSLWNKGDSSNQVLSVNSTYFNAIHSSDFLRNTTSFGALIFAINTLQIHFDNITINQTSLTSSLSPQLVYIENNLEGEISPHNYSLRNSKINYQSPSYFISTSSILGPFILNQVGLFANFFSANNSFSSISYVSSGGIYYFKSISFSLTPSSISFDDLNSTYSGISVIGNGGIIYCQCSHISFTNSSFSNVYAGNAGGIIYQFQMLRSSDILLTNLYLTYVQTNILFGQGGIIWANGMSDAEFLDEQEDLKILTKHTVIKMKNIHAVSLAGFYASALYSLGYQEISIENVKIEESSRNGLFCFSFRSADFLASDYALFNMTNVTVTPIVAPVIQYLGSSSTSISVPVQNYVIHMQDCNFYNQLNNQQRMQPFLNISSIQKSITFSYGGINQISLIKTVSSPLFYLSGIILQPYNEKSGFIISNIDCSASKMGCIFTVLAQKVGISNTLLIKNFTFVNITEGSNGGIAYFDSSCIKLKYTIVNCRFLNIFGSSGSGRSMIIYDISQVNSFPIQWQTIQNSSVQSLSGSSSIFGYFSCKQCRISFDSIFIENVTSTSSSLSALQVMTFESFIAVKINKLIMRSVLSSNLNINQNLFISVTSLISGYSFTIQNSEILCEDEVLTTSFMTFQKSVQGSLALLNNTFKNCGTFSTSIFEILADNIKLTDSESVYESNTASSVYRVSGLNFKADVNDCYYSQQTSIGTGGIFLFQSYFSLSIQNSIFYSNSAKNGGIIGVQDASNSIQTLNITILNCQFRDNKALIDGGVFWLSNPLLKVVIGQGTVFENNTCAGGGGVFYLVGVSTLDIAETTFVDNKGSDGQVMSSSARNAQFSISSSSISTTMLSETTSLSTFSISQKSTTVACYENTYSSNQQLKQGGVFYLDSVTFTDSNSVYKGNSAQVGGVISCMSCIMKTEHCSFSSNSATNGGVVYMNLDAQYTSVYDKFISNTATSTAGVILVNFNSLFSFTNTLFLYNSANLDSTISVYFSSQSSRFKISNCIFNGNTALSSFSLNFQYSKGDISKCSFTNNSASTLSPNIYISQSSITISDSTFYSTTQLSIEAFYLSGYYLYINSESDITVTSTTFTKGFGTRGGAIFMYGLSNLTVESSQFVSNTASINGGAIYQSGADKIKIQKTIFNLNSGLQGGNDYYGAQSSSVTSFSEVKITQTWPQSSIIGDQIGLEFKKSSVTSSVSSGRASQGGGIQCIECSSLVIQQSTFYGLSAQIGGALYIILSDDLKKGSEYFIADSIFNQCESNQGGAIYLSNPAQISITGNTIQNSRAVTNTTDLAYGGALFYTCSQLFNCDLLFEGNRVENCSSSNIGGGIYWDSVEPRNILNNAYFNNQAKQYGPNYACFPQRLANLTLNKMHSLMGRNLEVNTKGILGGYQSGAQMSPFYIAVLDKYGQVVSTDSNGKLQVRVVENQTLKNASEDYPPVLGGILKFESSFGVFNVSGITFTGSPGSSYSNLIVLMGIGITLETDIIDTKKPSNAEYLAALGNKSAIDFGIQIQLRECAVGESFSTTGQYISFANQCQMHCLPRGNLLLAAITNESWDLQDLPQRPSHMLWWFKNWSEARILEEK